MSLLAEVYAGNGDHILIDSFEISSTAFDESIYLCEGFEDRLMYVPERGEYVLFSNAPIKAEKERKDNRGDQTVQFVIDNVYEDSLKLMMQAYEAREPVLLTVRTYLHTDLSMPASNALVANVKTVEVNGSQVQVSAGFFDIIGTNFNRLTYNSDTAPAIRYE